MAFNTLTAKMSLVGLQPGYKIVFEAIDVAAGTTEANVTVSNAVIYPSDAQSLIEPEAFGPFMFVQGPAA